jgi:ribonuclease P protein component
MLPFPHRLALRVNPSLLETMQRQTSTYGAYFCTPKRTKTPQGNVIIRSSLQFKAIDRNRVKRIARSALAAFFQDHTRFDIVIMPNTKVRTISTQELYEDLLRVLG